MSNIKERIIGAITVMSDENAEKIWALIETTFADGKWENIEEVLPDEVDIHMLQEAAIDPDCHIFVSEKETYKELEI